MSKLTVMNRSSAKCELQQGAIVTRPCAVLVQVIPHYGCVVETLLTIRFSVPSNDKAIFRFPTHEQQAIVSVTVTGALQCGDYACASSYLLIPDIVPAFALFDDALEVHIRTIAPISFATTILVYLPFGDAQHPTNARVVMDLGSTDVELWRDARVFLQTHSGHNIGKDIVLSDETKVDVSRDLMLQTETNCRFYLELANGRRFGMRAGTKWSGNTVVLIGSPEQAEMTWKTRERRAPDRTSPSAFSFAMRTKTSAECAQCDREDVGKREDAGNAVLVDYLHAALKHKAKLPKVECVAESMQDAIVASTMRLLDFV